MSINNDINVLFFHVIHAFIKPQPHLNALPGLNGKIFWLLSFVFSNIAAVQILHEPEEGQFVEEDLGDLHQKVFSTVLQSLALKFTESVLEHRRCSGPL